MALNRCFTCAVVFLVLGGSIAREIEVVMSEQHLPVTRAQELSAEIRKSPKLRFSEDEFALTVLADGRLLGVVLLVSNGLEFQGELTRSGSSAIATVAHNAAAARARSEHDAESPWLALFLSPDAPGDEAVAVGGLGLTELAAMVRSPSVELVFLASERQSWAVELRDASAWWDSVQSADAFRALVRESGLGRPAGAESFLHLIGISGMRIVRAVVNGPELAELLAIDGWARVHWDRPVTILKR